MNNKKYFIKTYGCQMNESDSERIAAFLEKQGYKSASDIKEADLIVVNACSVRQSAIDRIFGLKPKIRKFKIQNPNVKFILTGCVLKTDKRKFKEFFDSLMPIYHLLSDRTKDGIGYFKIKPKREAQSPAYLPIMTGCDNFCSYCVVPYTRGREISQPVKKILKEIKNLVKNKYTEITLLGQNVNSYKYNFSNLLRKINNLAGDFTIKFLTNHPKDFSDELIDTIAKCKKIAKEIHLPIQSGDNEILKKMNRGYTIKQYVNLVKKIRQKIPNVKLSTDVIVGFPGETKNQFENTVKLFKEINYSKAYVNKYSTRSGTIAAKLKDNVPLQEKKRRWKILNELANRLQRKKLIVILGPTASGKSGLAVKIAKKYNGEIISADSRQIYKGMDIGTGKIPNEFNFRRFNLRKEVEPQYIYKGIPHHCLDIASPKKQFTVAEYKQKALEATDKIYKKNKIPILCGGTGFYIQAVVEGLKIPKIEPDWKLRKQLENKTTEQLFEQLKKLDPQRAKNIDSQNRRRLIRALEIILKTNKPVPEIKKEPKFDVLYIGIEKSTSELKKSIDKRVNKMIKSGLEKEVKNLIKKYGWTAVLKNAIGYQEFYKFTSFKDVINAIKLRTYQFAKRQMTWFRKYPGNKINWIRNYPEAEKLIKKFISTSFLVSPPLL